MSVLGEVLGLALEGLKLINTKEARKYEDDLLDLDRKREALELGPSEQFDSVAYVKIIKEILRVSKAARNDPAVFGKRDNP